MQTLRTNHREGMGLCPLFCFLILLLAPVRASADWVSPAVSDDSSHVWFRHLYLQRGMPREARVRVRTTGSFRLYVNQMNVGTALCYAPRAAGDSAVVSLTFDVSPYLRGDSNVIALVYSPAFPHATRRQVDVSYYGVDSLGGCFSYASGGDWLCRVANSGLSRDGGEWVDGRRHDPFWNAARLEAPALWTGVAVLPAAPWPCCPPPAASALVAVRQQSYFYNGSRGDSLSFDFGRPRRFQPRLTFREARRGEVVAVGTRLRYVCSGRMDEQAFPRFAFEEASVLTVTGDARFDVSQVTTVDLLEVGAMP